jgi:hypothetical protein
MLQTLSKVDPELAVTDAMHADHPPSLVSEHRTPMRVTADLRQPSVPGNFDRLMDRSSTVGISESSCVWHRRLAASQRGGREALERSLRGRIAAGAVGHVRWPTAGDYQRLHPPTPALQRRAVVIAPASALRSASVRGCSYCRELLQVPPVRCTSRCTDCRQAGRTSCFRRAEIAQAQPPGRGFPRHDRSAAITTGAVRCTATTLRMTATVRRTANIDCVLLRRPGWHGPPGISFTSSGWKIASKPRSRRAWRTWSTASSSRSRTASCWSPSMRASITARSGGLSSQLVHNSDTVTPALCASWADRVSRLHEFRRRPACRHGSRAPRHGHAGRARRRPSNGIDRQNAFLGCARRAVTAGRLLIP